MQHTHKCVRVWRGDDNGHLFTRKEREGHCMNRYFQSVVKEQYVSRILSYSPACASSRTTNSACKTRAPSSILRLFNNTILRKLHLVVTTTRTASSPSSAHAYTKHIYLSALRGRGLVPAITPGCPHSGKHSPLVRGTASSTKCTAQLLRAPLHQL